jgi:hypothetical protein
MEELTGTWTGIIIYGPEYGDIENEELFFSAELNCTDGIILGTSVDLNEEYETGTATINGFLKNNLISFIKQYEFDSYYDETGKVIVDKSKKGPEINYQGQYDSIKNTIEGHWEIIYDVRKQGENLLEYVLTGTFRMKKK